MGPKIQKVGHVTSFLPLLT